jgi:hypothetical protein
MTTKCATGFTRIDDAWGLRKALGERREAAIGDFASEKWRFETCCLIGPDGSGQSSKNGKQQYGGLGAPAD